MAKAQLPLIWRDGCAGLLIPLNECRLQNFALPWKCGALRNDYYKCEAEDYYRRAKIAKELALKELKQY
uniref:NADH dehydrogenase [ubiquinone] 1 beta subcomplex subunit 7 n=1 Tax=Arcella intermedia TaxID=1963864 RepID=A0A6B2LXY5_9EUKA